MFIFCYITLFFRTASILVVKFGHTGESDVTCKISTIGHFRYLCAL